MKELYVKECPVCGTEFETYSRRRKYCDKHTKNGGRMLAQMEKRQVIDKLKRESNKLYSFDCELCGRHHIVPKYLLSDLTISAGAKSNWNDEPHFFCCVQHKEQARQDHAKCDNCGKSLKGNTYGYSAYRQFNFCSAKCEEEHKLEIAKEKGWVHICEFCGKEFIRQKEEAFFCSNDCYKAAKKQGWASPKDIERQSKKVTMEFICCICGKRYKQQFKNQVDAQLSAENIFNVRTCSKECRSIYNERLAQKFKEMRKKEREEKKAAEKLPKPGEQLCSTCKVSYKDCERMQSNFRILPKGAHYNDKGILVECPKYRS